MHVHQTLLILMEIFRCLFCVISWPVFFFFFSSGLCCVGFMLNKELPRTSGDQHAGAKAKTKWHEHDRNQVPVHFSALFSLHTFLHLRIHN